MGDFVICRTSFRRKATMGIKKLFLYFALSLCLIISIGCTPNLSIDIPTVPVSIPVITTAILTNTSQPTLPPNLPTSTSQPTSTNQPTGNFQVHFVDVGQGDAELIITPHGNTILIDGGEKGSGIIAYLAKVGIKKIDIMVATHPHSDHIGGLVEVLNSLPVAEVITTGGSNTTDLFMDFLTGIENAKAQYV